MFPGFRHEVGLKLLRTTIVRSPKEGRVFVELNCVTGFVQ